MCRHNNEDDYDCGKCCFEYGVDDAEEGLPYDPQYKNFEQINDYEAGYNSVKDKNV